MKKLLIFIFLLLIPFVFASQYNTITLPTKICEQDDVSCIGLSDLKILSWNATQNKWIPRTISATGSMDYTNICLLNQSNTFVEETQYIPYVQSFSVAIADYNDWGNPSTFQKSGGRTKLIMDGSASFDFEGTKSIRVSPNQIDYFDICLNDSTGCPAITTTYYSPTSFSNTSGTTEGSYTYVNHTTASYDGLTFNITEKALAPALEVYFNFTGVTNFNNLIIRYYTTAITGSNPSIQIYSYSTSSWEDYGLLGESTSFVFKSLSIYDSADHISGGIVRLRFYKSSSGNINNKYLFDWIALSTSTSGSQEIDPLSIHTDAINTTFFNYTNGQLQLTNTGTKSIHDFTQNGQTPYLRYHLGGGMGTVGTASAINVRDIFTLGLPITSTKCIDQFMVRESTAGNNNYSINFGIYNTTYDGSLYLNQLITSCYNRSLNVTNGIVNCSIAPTTLKAGMYWLAIVVNGTGSPAPTILPMTGYYNFLGLDNTGANMANSWRLRGGTDYNWTGAFNQTFPSTGQLYTAAPYAIGVHYVDC